LRIVSLSDGEDQANEKDQDIVRHEIPEDAMEAPWGMIH
jgi:hypothetical protein